MELDRLAAEVAALSAAARQAAASCEVGTAGDARASISNLLAYLEFRNHDLRALQLELAGAGLSSLGRLEPHVLFTLRQVLARLGIEGASTADDLAPNDASAIAEARATRLLGRPREARHARIMVTIDGRTAAEEGRLAELLRAGMDLARVNCARDSPADWVQIIERLRAAEDALADAGTPMGRRCRVMMDLGGPKIRTGPLALQSHALRVEVPYDADGRRVRPARVLLDASEPWISAPAEGHALLGLRAPTDRLAGIEEGALLHLTDLRGRECVLQVTRVVGSGRIEALLDRSAYLDDSVALRLPGGDSVSLAPTAPQPVRVRLRAGDELVLYRDPGRKGHEAYGHHPGGIACTLPAALDNVQPGHRVFIDDGRLATIVTGVTPEGLLLRVTSPASAYRLKPEKGINFPDTRLGLPALTPLDREDLRVVAAHADAVGLSFVHDADDIRELAAALADLGHADLPVVAKIETADAVHALARILVAGLALPSFGVMIARGDLAVEVGFENLASVQDDILCLCEAAHVPAIWATQVLETLARSGLPARAEISDATLGQRAECVMLNKGPHIVEATRTLASLLIADARRHLKKRDLFQEFTAQLPIADEASLAPAPGQRH